MSYQTAQRTSAIATSLVAFITYLLTAAPTVTFWRSADLAASTSVFGIPEPPASPFWLIMARVAALLLPGDAAHAAALFSALCSALTAGVVVLIVCALVDRWYDVDDDRRTLPAIGGGVVAGLSFAWAHSQWRAATTASTEPLAVLLVATALLLMLRWSASAHERGHARCLLAVSFVVGLLAGVDTRLVVVAPALAAIVFMRAVRATPSSVASAVAVAIVGGWAFDRLITAWLPAVLDGSSLLFVIGIPVMLAMLVGAASAASDERAGPAALVAAVCGMALIGATTVITLPLRGASHPPTNAYAADIDEPVGRLMGVDAASDVPLWPRRWSVDPARRRYQDRYGSWSAESLDDPLQASVGAELRFLWRYQFSHMYLRYVLWNYVGRASDHADAPSTWLDADAPPPEVQQSATGSYPYPIRHFALPLLLALAGLFVHVRRDPRAAMALIALIVLGGIGIVVSASLQQPQPRERDALYLASFLVMAVWTGIGAAALAARVAQNGSDESEANDDARHDDRHEALGGGLAGVAIALCIVAAPLNMLLGGWTAHDRSVSRVAWDYAYNLLQSCDSNAVLLTAGDNDTFPLMYLQDAAGVRRDVRVVNLRMMNDPEYLRRITRLPRWTAEPLPIAYADSILASHRDLSVDVGSPQSVTVPLASSTAKHRTIIDTTARDSARASRGSMTWLLRGPAVGREGMHMFRPQERALADLLRGNAWQRPIYFSSSVPVDDRAGLDAFLRREGLALRVVPGPGSIGGGAIDTVRTRRALLAARRDDAFSTHPAPEFMLRGLDGGVGYLDPEERRIVALYRHLYLTLAEAEMSGARGAAGVRELLESMEERIPSHVHPMPYWMSAGVATLYMRAGVVERAREAAERAVDAVDALGSEWRRHPHARTYHPVQVKAQMLALLGEYDRAIAAYDELRRRYPDDAHLRGQIEELRIERHLARRDTAAALGEIDAIVAGYDNAIDPAMRNNAAAYAELASELRGRDSTTKRKRRGGGRHE